MIERTGRAIKMLRVRAGLSQEEVGDKVGLTSGMMSMLETGKRQTTMRTMYDIAGVLNCRLSEIVLLAEQLEGFDASRDAAGGGDHE